MLTDIFKLCPSMSRMSFTDSDSLSDGYCTAGSFGSCIILKEECSSPQCKSDACYQRTDEFWTIGTSVAEVREVLGSFQLTASGLRIKQQPFSESSDEKAYLDDTIPALHEMRMSSASYQSIAAEEAACQQHSCAITHQMAANIAAATGLAYMHGSQPVTAFACTTRNSRGLHSKACRLYSQQQLQQLEMLRQQYGSEQQHKQPLQLSSDVRKSDVLVKLAGLPQQLYNKLKNSKYTRSKKPPVHRTSSSSFQLAPRT